eukprot:CAMPEP_0119480704 /NCGR_PEP_ID=MMETSP1344-20130328/9393_1 /TAXON_ID=236787 /ORGANISM="Florenciella parvula, Strain CCMP2471" /LENGTH=70 /DNA_ID=CAMNT_0007515039 /DNA_START=176 /DNA_END=384 /DNA_ORIENTATION=+
MALATAGVSPAAMAALRTQPRRARAGPRAHLPCHSPTHPPPPHPLFSFGAILVFFMQTGFAMLEVGNVNR